MTTGRALQFASGRPLVLAAILGSEGREGAVYAVRGNDSLAVKLYKPDAAPPRAKLDWFLANRMRARAAQPDDQGFMLAWPYDIVLDPTLGGGASVVGIALPRVPMGVDLFEVINAETRREQEKRGWTITWRDSHIIARRLALAVAAAHDLGLILADLGDKNALVVRNANEVALIDLDSAQVTQPGNTGASWRSHLWTDGFLASEFMEQTAGGLSPNRLLMTRDRTMSSDAFTLGVLIFQLLCNGHHPFAHAALGPAVVEGTSTNDMIFAGTYPYDGPRLKIRPPDRALPFDALHPAVRQAFTACFRSGRDNPALRPLPRQWAEILNRAIGDLVPCPKQHWFVRERGHCHVCGPAPAKLVSSPISSPARKPSPPPVRSAPPVTPPVRVSPANSYSTVWRWGQYAGNPGRGAGGQSYQHSYRRRSVIATIWSTGWSWATNRVILFLMICLVLWFLIAQSVIPGPRQWQTWIGRAEGGLSAPTPAAPKATRTATLTPPIVDTTDSRNGGYSPAIADGDLATIWTASREDGAATTFAQVDLGATMRVDTIRWLVPADGEGASVRISTSKDRKTWTDVRVVTITSSRAGHWQLTRIDRSVRAIRLTFDHWPSATVSGELAEIEVQLAEVAATAKATSAPTEVSGAPTIAPRT